jgi:hypothetical protein
VTGWDPYSDTLQLTPPLDERQISNQFAAWMRLETKEENCSPRLDRSQRLALLAQAFRLVVRALRDR